MHIRSLIKENRLFDSHAHLNFEGYNKDLEQVINRALDSKVEVIYDIGTDIASSKRSVGIAKKFPEVVYSFVGIDPEIFLLGSEMFIGLDKDNKWIEEQYSTLKDLALENTKYIKGIGESGMDYYWLEKLTNENEGSINSNKEVKKTKDLQMIKKSKELQEALFRMHLELAKEFNLPLSIHSRGAEKECLQIVKQYPNTTGIFHSYTGDYKIATQILDAGWGLGINGIITFKNALALREIYRKIIGDPTDFQPYDFYDKGIFFETDSPFLSPEGKRGERNEPSYVKIIYNKLINIKS